MSAESDLMTAVGLRWDTYFLDSISPGGLHLDQLPRGDTSLPVLPYTIFSVRRDRPPKWSQRTFLEYTRLTFETYDTEVVGPTSSSIANAFKWDYDNKLDFSLAPTTVAHIYTSLGDTFEGVTGLERAGKKIRRGVLTLIIWTRRTDL